LLWFGLSPNILHARLLLDKWVRGTISTSLKLSNEYFQCFLVYCHKIDAISQARAQQGLVIAFFARSFERRPKRVVCVIIAAEAEGFLFSFPVDPVGQIR